MTGAGTLGAARAGMNSPASLNWDVADQVSLESFPPMAVAHVDDTPGELTVSRRRHARFMRGVIAVGMALGGLMMLAMRVRRRTR